MNRNRVPTVLSIAGSDSGGGAGIQADLKAIARCGAHGMTAITAITAQNTVGVEMVEAVSPEAIMAQIAAVSGDIGVDAVKVGMVGSAEAIESVVASLALMVDADVPIVLDPVMVSESGASLLDPDAAETLVARLLPMATVATPNIPEARALTGANGLEGQEELARRVHALGPRAVVVTGGHSEEMKDFFFDGERTVEIVGERYEDGAAHGSGCTHSSALAAFLAHGDEPLEAARRAREVASAAVGAGLRELGEGPGPVDVFGLTGSGAAMRRPRSLPADF